MDNPDASSRTSRRWLRLVTIAFITYSLAYLDRVNYGFGAAGGLAKTLNITPNVASLLGATFFLGYFLFQIPGGHYAESKSAKRLIFWALLLWGVFATATGLITNIPLLFLDRFALGVVESIILPGLIILLSHWFTRAERSRANTCLILGNPVTVLWASIVSGYLISALDWRWMFILEGIPAIVWAFIWRANVEDYPHDARWLPRTECQELEDALAREQAVIPPVSSLRAALTQPNVIVLSIQYLFWSVGIYGFVLWLPSIVEAASHQGIVATGWLTSIPYLVAILAMFAASQYADRTLNRKGLTAAAMFVGALAFYASYLIGPAHFAISMALLVVAAAAMYAPYGPFFAMIPDFLPKNVAGAATAMINSFGALGGFAGTYLVGFLNARTGSPAASFSLMAAALAIAGILTLLVRVAQPKASTMTAAA